LQVPDAQSLSLLQEPKVLPSLPELELELELEPIEQQPVSLFGALFIAIEEG
tara:strand:- start:171 stop:326 length:156 start_codon:yes stop_codon:yes gene_type:complete